MSKLTFRIDPARCRIGQDPGGDPWLQLVYAANGLVPPGTRQRLVPALKEALAEEDLSLIALDIFDEFVRLHLPLKARASVVERALAEATADLEPIDPEAAPESQEAKTQLARYLRESQN